MSSMLEKKLEQIRLEKIIVATSARISEKADFDTIARGPGLGAGYFLILTMSLLGTVLTVGVMYALQKRKKSIASIARAVAPPSLTVLTEIPNETAGSADDAPHPRSASAATAGIPDHHLNQDRECHAPRGWESSATHDPEGIRGVSSARVFRFPGGSDAIAGNSDQVAA